MIFLYVLLLLVGFVLLVKGADLFVDGSAGIAKKCKISPLVIGLTVVAFGTSLPELTVSVSSAIAHSTDLAVGNVVGSNIVNILLILGLSSLMSNLPVQKNSLRIDLPILILAGGLFILFGMTGESIVWWEGLILLLLFVAYLILLIKLALSDRAKNTDEIKVEPVTEGGKLSVWYHQHLDKLWFLLVILLIGICMIAGGGTLLVRSAKEIAYYFGVSERIVGLTVVAIGTSLPELVTSVVAAKKGETDIAVGNIIGSNLCNLMLVGGASALFYPLAFTTVNLIDALVALGASVLLLVCSLGKKHRLGKVSGSLMLVCFVAYYVTLFLV